MWLTEDWTNDRDKWISLNIRFYWVNCTRKVYRCRIILESSLCLVLKVSDVERLSCVLVCGYSASRRWGWSLCLVQIVGVAVWLGCWCWRQSIMRTHCLQRLEDQYPGLCIYWLTRCVSMWPQSAFSSLSSVIACGQGFAEAVWLMFQFIQSLVDWVCQCGLKVLVLIQTVW